MAFSCGSFQWLESLAKKVNGASLITYDAIQFNQCLRPSFNESFAYHLHEGTLIVICFSVIKLESGRV